MKRISLALPILRLTLHSLPCALFPTQRALCASSDRNPHWRRRVIRNLRSCASLGGRRVPSALARA